jgi:PKD repeat protein
MKKIYFSTLILAILLWSVNSFSQSVKPEKIIKPIGFAISKKLSDVKPIPPGLLDRTWKDKLIPNKEGFLDEFKTESTWKGPDPVLQNNLLKAVSTTTATIGKNFAGQVNRSGVAPPDTQGDVSAEYYMQMVNLSFRISNKNGDSLYGGKSSTLWEGFTGPWTGTNDGDPIVLYDQIADRWIATQFSLPNYPAGPFYELVAISKSNNPLGEWYQYAYEFVNMPDYPKFGVWSDGYYMTMNQFKSRSGTFAGAAVSVFDRTEMLKGNPNASMQFFNLGTSYGSLLPADADGPAPPAGSGNYLANLGTNSLRIWEAKINWTTPSFSTVSLKNTLATSSFSYSGISIKQPGVSQTLDALASRLMYRLQYRTFGSYEVMLTNHTVNANGSGQAGVRWYELRKPSGSSGNWYIYQQGTYAPADGNGRWMGSVAMNGNGDIGLGYSVSGASYPSIRFTGQSAANSGTGVLDVPETTIMAGTKSQTGVNRWGDYSMMSIDPDDNTFWYTTEYSNGGWDWKTQIASFSFGTPTVIAPVAEFSGSPVNVVAGQNVTFTDQSANNPTNWAWSFPGGTLVTPSTINSQNPVVAYPTAGTYNVSLTATNSAGSNTITKSGYITVTNSGTTYCVSKGSNTSKEWIQSVAVGSNPTVVSGNNSGYKDNTGINLTLSSGSSVNITLTPGFPVKSRAEYWRVWIDYNADGDFLDSGELVFSANALKIAAAGTITIPSGLTGQTRMRVSMQYNAAPTSCQLFTFGEVEDYTVSFSSPPAAPVADLSQNSKTQPAVTSRAQNISLDLYPNPASNQLNVVVTGASETVNIKVYNALGQIIKDFDVKNSKATINLSNYQKGMYYIGVDDGVQNALKKFIKE